MENVVDYSYKCDAPESFVKLNDHSFIANENQNPIVINIKKGSDILDIPVKMFGSMIMDHIEWHFIDQYTPILKLAINRLLLERDFLGHQLNFQFGNISEDEFNEITERYLIEHYEYPDENLKNNILKIMKISNLTFDSDQLSIMFNCSIDQAEKILQEIISE